MEEKKAERLEKSRKWRQRLLSEVRNTYLRTCPANTIAPPAAELYLFEPFRTVIEDQSLDCHEADGIKIFREPMKQLDEIVRTWRAEKDSVLLNMMKKTVRSKSTLSIEHLNLATTFFKYKDDMKQAIAYPRVLTIRSYPMYESGGQFKELFRSVNDGGFWNMNKEISFHNEAAAAARIIVETCGFDPTTATTAQLDAKCPIIECVSCSDATGGYNMSWKQAVCSVIILKLLSTHIPWYRLHMVLPESTTINLDGNSSLMKN